MNSLPPFARVIKEQRDRLHMSRAQLAEASELSYPYISQLETGLRKPSRKAAHAIAGALGLSVEELERTIPADGTNPEEVRKAEVFSDSLLSSRTRSAGPVEGMAMAAPPSLEISAPGSRDDLIGDMIDLLEEFDSSERLDVLAEVQKRAMQRMLDERNR
ncbi:helix-turn-helix transcriptional regulator [Aeromicrobium stalagmiti]|uniref:helix-turn-helix transcriptional regulator n=1 Tax=Aeromicrobium stalagmiti TaxID=2738988 RepID=UPI0015685663|nr:helix-turn-helix transcriptional regulator [Aeromicrobium stalagmiti]NRQ50417.1 helix-turn-helix transcriptional regulator [Aeromicrobium stalagmiti]